jgi:hypothetical protein
MSIDDLLLLSIQIGSKDRQKLYCIEKSAALKVGNRLRHAK